MKFFKTKYIRRSLARLLLISLLLPAEFLLPACSPKTEGGKIKRADRYEKEDGSDADKRNEEGKIKLTAGEVTLLLPEDFSDYAALEVKEITPPKPLGDLRAGDMKVYDIDLEQFTESGCYFDIRLPYSDFNLGAEAAEDNIGAAYYNPDSGQWEPLVFELDQENEEVVIKTNHFSVYSCFNIKNSKTKESYINYVESFNFHHELFKESDLTQAYEMVKAAAANKGLVPPTQAQEALKWEMTKTDILSQSITVGSFIADNWKASESDDFGAVGGVLSDYTLALSGVAIALDMWHSWRGSGTLSLEDHQRFASDSLKAVVNYGSGFLLSSTGAVILLAAAPVEGAITSARNAIIENEKDAYRKGYEIFYRDYYPRSVNEWADFLEKARENVLNEERLMLRIEGEIKRYTEACWDALDETWYFCIGDADLKKNIGGHFRRAALHKNEVHEKMRKEISEEFAKKITAEVLPLALEEVCMRDYLKSYKELKLKLEALREELNKEVTFEFYDSGLAEDGGESVYKNDRVYLYDEEDMLLDKEWSVQLDEEGKGSMSFSLIGWYEVGTPESIRVYKENAVIGDDPPVLDFPIVNWIGYEHRIPLASGVKLEDIWGNYFNVTMRMGEYHLTEKMRNMLLEEIPGEVDVCGHKAPDIIAGFELSKQYPQPWPMDFTLLKSGEYRAGIIDIENSRAMRNVFYATTESFTYDESGGTLRFILPDAIFPDTEFILRFSYDENGEIKFTGDATFYASSILEGDESYITYIVQGSKSEALADGQPLY